MPVITQKEKDAEEIRKCKELLKKARIANKPAKKKPQTREQKIKKETKEINKEYKKIQNKVENIDDIKEKVNTIKDNIAVETKASKNQKVIDNETLQVSEPIRQGEQKPTKYTPEVKKEIVKEVINEMNDIETVVNKTRGLDEEEKETIKNLERKRLLVDVDKNENMPELFKLEVLEMLNIEVEKRNRYLPKMVKNAKVGTYEENSLMLNNLFPDFELEEVFDSKIYVDNKTIYREHNRFIKDILTDYVNSQMLVTNDHQIRLMSVIYKHMNPWLKETGSKLIFYGGNLMRQIHRNINEYFDPESQHVFEEFFGSFVKKSDNDFSLMLGVNALEIGDINDPETAKKYDIYHNKCFTEVAYILENIRNEIMTDLFSHFSFFKYSESYKTVEYDKIKLYLQEGAAKIDSRIKIRNVKIAVRSDQMNLYPDNTRDLLKKNKMNFYKNKESNVIYNSYNNALHFKTPTVAHFSLMRSKVNFKIDGTFVSKEGDSTYEMEHEYGGELIDFGIPYLMDGGAFGPFSSKYKKYGKKDGNTWLRKWLKRKVEVIRVEEYDFSYMLYGNRYQVDLLFFILFFFPGRPWLAPKYAKRVARSILFEFYWLIDQYPVGSDSLKKIKEIFRNMSSEMLQRIVKETEIACDTIETEEDRINYNKWMETLKLYVSKIIIGIDSLIEYFDGKKEITRKELFKLNIVGS